MTKQHGCIGMLVIASWLGVARLLVADDAEWFKERIEPIFVNHCLECHSHETGKLKGGLTLDSRSGWATGGDSGPAVVPGKPDESLLIKAVRHRDNDLKMPPEKKLSDAHIALLEEWVKRGAPDPRILDPAKKVASTEWWATQPLVKPNVAGQGSAVVDTFIKAKLEKHNLNPSPAADRRTLLRRLTFDLWGLPPTREELTDFIHDSDPQAVEKVVDRLLASPRYGERMTRHWLDVVRFGESHGFGMDLPRFNAWRYRDYLLAAFNSDKPYARFVQEQIAADVLFADTPALIPALGFLAGGPFNQSALVEQVDGTECKKIALNLDRDDMVSNVATTFLSITLHCARCHDHKFDPLTQTDYYRMQAVFAGVARGDRDFDADPALASQRQQWTAARNKLEATGDITSLSDSERGVLTQKLTAWRQAVERQEQGWQTVEAAIAAESPETLIQKLPDGSYRVEGKLAETDTYTVSLEPKFPMPIETLTGLRLEVLTDSSLPFNGPGRQPSNGNLTVTELKISAVTRTTPNTPQALKISRAVADFNQQDWGVEKSLDGNPGTGWGIHPQEGRSHAAVYELAEPLALKDVAQIIVRIEQTSGRSHLVGCLKLAVTNGLKPADVVPMSPDQRTAAADQLTADSVKQWKSVGPRLVDDILNALPPKQTVWAIGSQIAPLRNYRPPVEPYPIHILQRGDVKRPTLLVAPGGLQHVPSLRPDFELVELKQEGERRAQLAHWLTDTRNPLTWRSIANRMWRWHFGRGLVETPNDFGRMGGSPSHPELLDWLACELRDGGGSLKSLHRTIVLSAAYRQAVGRRRVVQIDGSHHEEDQRDPRSEIDADNRFVWRQNRQRLDAEQLRDAILATSGRLDLTMNGPSVKQFNMTVHDTVRSPLIDYDGFDPDSAPSRRRTVYRFLFRNVNDPLLETFDAVDPSLSVPQRAETTTPLQALSLFNNRFVLRHCEHLAERLQHETADPGGRIERAFELLFARLPSDVETQALTAYAAEHGLANTCRILLNCNEFLFID